MRATCTYAHSDADSYTDTDNRSNSRVRAAYTDADAHANPAAGAYGYTDTDTDPRAFADVYGVDVSDLPNPLLLAVFARIVRSQGRSPESAVDADTR